MNLFDKLVQEALKNHPELNILKHVVEKELLQHDILRILSSCDFLKDLTFIGGTCLRLCYGGIRLSEDLDFTGGINFSRANLTDMGKILIDRLSEKYGLKIQVSEPIQDKLDVDTWKVKIETNPGSKHLPVQRINIDICSISSYEKKPTMIVNPYNIDMGTSTLIIFAQSQEEIFADKLIAFALRPSRIKYRDLWDIMWLKSKAIEPRISLIPLKLKERKIQTDNFLSLFQERLAILKDNPSIEVEFNQEMMRFLPKNHYNNLKSQKLYWLCLQESFFEFFEKIGKVLK
jgi:predicted nucleotidyltransferase component of viral defense system